MNGLILPDVPISHERIKMIAKEANGFVYCVSSLGVTGTRTEITTDIGAMVKLVKEAKDVPCAVGFGISTPEQAKNMAAQSDGAIVGSAIVKLCAAYEMCIRDRLYPWLLMNSILAQGRQNCKLKRLPCTEPFHT